MNLGRIRTDRFHQHKYWYQIVYEWEDVFCKTLCLPLVSNQNRFYDSEFVVKVIGKYGIYKFFQIVDALGRKKTKDIYFDMGPRFTFTHAASANVIPIIIDFWKYIDITRFNKMYANSKLVCISSLEAYEYLKEHGCKVPLAFLPLSIPDIYQVDMDKPFEKKFDFVVAGRNNRVLQSYLDEFTAKYPFIEYVSTIERDKNMFYSSNKKGILGKAETREQYLDIIKSGKIAFYSTPGIDGGEVRTGGFNPVTPRLFELIYAGCRLMGRYPKTNETDFFELNSICPHVNSYESFEAIALQYLSEKEQPLLENRKYLQNHYTSRRALQLKELLNQL